jgi:hypothetical protein
MQTSPLPKTVEANPPIPFIDEEVGSAAHEKHMPSVRAIASDPDRGLVLLNLVGADASVSAVIMELLRSKSNGVGFMPTLFGVQPTNLPTQLTIQTGIRYTAFRSALATLGGSISLKNWCLLISTANIGESRRRAPIIPPQLLPPPPAPATTEGAPAVPADTSPAAPSPHYVIGAAGVTTPEPNTLLGHLRAIGVVVADAWAEYGSSTAPQRPCLASGSRRGCSHSRSPGATTGAPAQSCRTPCRRRSRLPNASRPPGSVR